MAISVDHDQTAPSAGSALFAYAILSDTLDYEVLGHLLYYYFSENMKLDISNKLFV